MRHRAVNKKLIFFPCIRIPACLASHSIHLVIHSFSFPRYLSPLLSPSSFPRRLIQSLIGKEAALNFIVTSVNFISSFQLLFFSLLRRFFRTRLLLIVAGRTPDALSRFCAGGERTLPFQRTQRRGACVERLSTQFSRVVEKNVAHLA